MRCSPAVRLKAVFDSFEKVKVQKAQLTLLFHCNENLISDQFKIEISVQVVSLQVSLLLVFDNNGVTKLCECIAALECEENAPKK